MLARIRPRLTYANVMATIAVFIALGGASYAALKLPSNSVGAKQLKKNSVTAAKIRKEAVTAAKIKKGTLTGTQIKASTLDTVPTAQTANSLAAPEGWHEVGAPGEPEFNPGTHWHNSIFSAFQTTAFYKDHEGVVHLRGRLEGGVGNILFKLPSGYLPAAGKEIQFPMVCFGGGKCTNYVGEGAVTQEGWLVGPQEATAISLEGITFRAEG